jgi:hypothetical protein
MGVVSSRVATEDRDGWQETGGRGGVEVHEVELRVPLMDVDQQRVQQAGVRQAGVVGEREDGGHSHRLLVGADSAERA